MVSVTCPSCGEKGSLPDHLIGKKIRCQKCGKSFLAGSSSSEVTPSTSHAIAAASGVGKTEGGTIEVDGIDASTWASNAVAVDKLVLLAEGHHEPTPAFTASPQGADHSDAPARQYKVLTQKDRWFEGKFELAKLEEALNHYARQGWVVRAMATPHVVGFSGGPREELVILMER